MKFKKLIIVIFTWVALIGSDVSLYGQGYFELTEDVRAAYHSVSRLKLDEAAILIEKVKRDEPDNLLIYHVENYIDFFTLFINEEKDVYDVLKDNKEKRIDKISEGDQSSPYYLFSIAEINLQWATARLKFGKKFQPFREVYKAFNLLEENQRKFPDFIANKKSLSIIHALGESLPGLIQTLTGINGSIDKGTKEIQEVVAYSDANPDFLFREESYAIYAYILFYQNNERQKAYEVLKAANLNISESPLLCFLLANISQKTGHNDEAISILENRPTGPEYLPFRYLEFMYGKFLMYKLDPKAIQHMEVYTNTFKGRHFIKEAYQKLAWYALVTNDDIVGYKKYMALCDEHGHELVDEDKQASKEASSNTVPNSILLKARLLYDGGYYSKAYNLLVLKSHLFLADSDMKLEFNYRMGRISQALGNLTDAIDYYLLTIDQGEDEDSYFACNSALQVALILEQQSKYSKALQLFERCLNIKSLEYQASLHQKAKTGKERVEKKIKK